MAISKGILRAFDGTLFPVFVASRVTADVNKGEKDLFYMAVIATYFRLTTFVIRGGEKMAFIVFFIAFSSLLSSFHVG